MQSPSPTGPNRLVYLVKVPYLARGTAALAAATVLGAALASPADAAELRSAAPSSSTASSTPTATSSTSTSTPTSSGTAPSEPSTMSAPSSTASPSASAGADEEAAGAGTAAGAATGEVVSVESFGADGTDELDDTAALEAALGAIEPGQVLDFGDGLNFRVEAVASLTTDGVILSGKSTITSTNEEASSFRIAADDVTVKDLTFDTAGVTQRWDAYEQQRLHIDGGTGVTLDGVTSRGSAAAGIYVGGGASDVLLQDFTVEDSQADGIHITQGASDVTVASPQVTNSGDDGGAVVSYAQDGPPVTNVAFTDAVIDGTNARGLSVVGGTDVSFTGFEVSDTAAAGLYIASEGEWGTTGVDGVTASGGTITGANTDEATDHGAVLVYDSTSEAVTDVLVEDLTITDTRESASRQIGVLAGEPDAITDVTITDVTITGGPEQTLGLDDPDQAVAVTGVTQDGEAVADVGTPSGDAGADTTPTGADTTSSTDPEADSTTGNGAVPPTTPRPTPTPTDDTAEEESAATPDEQAAPGDGEVVTQDEAFEDFIDEFILWWGARAGANDVDTEPADTSTDPSGTDAATSDADAQEGGLVDPADPDLPAPSDVGGDETPPSSSDPTPTTGSGTSSSTSGSADDTDTTTGAAAGNPFAAGEAYVDPSSSAAQAAAAATDPAEEAALSELAAGGSAVWVTGTSGDVATEVAGAVQGAQDAGQVPVIAAYNIPSRDCSGALSAGGAGSAEEYQQWIGDLAGALDGGPAAVVLEPDALADLDCLPAEAQSERLDLLADAGATLEAAGASVYLDAGNPGWVPAGTMAERLEAAGVDDVRGFAVNVSNFQTTEANETYGDALVEATGGEAHYLIDTSRNGSGSAAGGAWCNPDGVTVGEEFTTDTGNENVDALVWVKVPGESDGSCDGAPAAGQFSTDLAAELTTGEAAASAPATPSPATTPAPALAN